MHYRRLAVLLSSVASVMLSAVLLSSHLSPAPANAAAATPNPDQQLHDKIMPILDRHCIDCHGNGNQKGNFTLDSFKTASDIPSHRAQWESMIKHLRGGTMPPATAKTFPTFQERNLVADWLLNQLSTYAAAHPDPGPNAIHRLTLAEYRNTIHDLLGIDFKPTDAFPADEAIRRGIPVSTGPSLTPELKQKYTDAANQIIDDAMPAAWAQELATKPTAATKDATARKIVQDFARRAWHRPLKPAELDSLIALFTAVDKEGKPFEDAIKAPLKATLASPNFILRGILPTETVASSPTRPLNEHELASRLSYFLWSSTPDAELLNLADRQQLRATLPAQVKRMLASPKADALAENFTSRWLQLADLDITKPDKTIFPEYDAEFRDMMRKETQLFSSGIMRNDLSVMDYLNGNYSFINQRLANFYGITGVQGDQFRRVSLENSPRRGVLTQASILTITSYWVRTSSPARGKWVMMNFLGLPGFTPNPPAPELTTAGHADSGTFRKQLEKHKTSQSCNYCHVQIDPLGLALENFDGIGKWRDKDAGEPIDASGQLPTGESFNGAVQMINILAEHHRAEFLDCIAKKMLAYALGRQIDATDQPAIDQIVAGMQKNDLKFSSLINGIVNSMPFDTCRNTPPITTSQPAPK